MRPRESPREGPALPRLDLGLLASGCEQIRVWCSCPRAVGLCCDSGANGDTGPVFIKINNSKNPLYLCVQMHTRVGRQRVAGSDQAPRGVRWAEVGA